MRDKLTALEKKWILYDVANSAFTMMVSTIIPIFFNQLSKQAGISEVDYLAYWGYTISLTTVIVALLGPVLGAAADRGGRKRRVFAITIILGAIGCAALGFAGNWFIFLGVFCIVRVLYSLSLVIYDSTLVDVTTEDRMDNVSSQGYAWGYIGSCVPFIACLLLVLFAEQIGISQMKALTVSMIVTALWWGGVSIPLLKSYWQKNFIEEEQQTGILKQLRTSLKDLVQDKKILLFLLAFFFYIDGVYTIIDMSTAYGTALGLNTTDMLLALLVTQFVAFPCALLYGRLAQKGWSGRLILVAIAAYTGIAIFAIFMNAAWQFWILAVVVGMFQGGIQSLSRSYFTKIIPAERSGEFFGFYDICGKGASFIGTTVMSLVSQLTGVANYGVGVIAVFFVIGLVLFIMSTRVSDKTR
jgi:MFS transporter, UMF1 family